MINLWTQLIESMTPNRHETRYYLTEGCANFAYALWVIKGKPEGGKIGMISDPHGEPWYGNGDDEEPTHDIEATHVYYVELDGRTLDVKGYRTPQVMMDDMFVSARVMRPSDPESFRLRWMGDDDTKPLFGSDVEIAEAISVIKRFPDLYGL